MPGIAQDQLAQEPLNKPKVAAGSAGEMQKSRPHRTLRHSSLRYVEKDSLAHCLAPAWRGMLIPMRPKGQGSAAKCFQYQQP